MASLAQAAYCGPMKAMRHWACQPCIESGTQLARGTWRFVHSELHRDRNHTFVSLGRLEGPEPLSNSCFLSARGTERLSNFETDAECLPVPLPLDWDCPGGLCARLRTRVGRLPQQGACEWWSTLRQHKFSSSRCPAVIARVESARHGRQA